MDVSSDNAQDSLIKIKGKQIVLISDHFEFDWP